MEGEKKERQEDLEEREEHFEEREERLEEREERLEEREERLEEREEREEHEEHESELITIIVNTREFQVQKGEISFEKVVALAFNPVPTGPNVMFSVTYHRGEGNKSGELFPGQTVKVKDGMVFDVTPTDKS